MEASLETPETLHTPYDVPADVAVLDGFCDLDEQGLRDFIKTYGLAMDLGDITFCQKYFKETEKRTPTITEINLLYFAVILQKASGNVKRHVRTIDDTL